MVYLYLTDVKFGVFKHTHIPTKVDYKSIIFNTKITNKDEKGKQKENMLSQGLNLGRLGGRPACCP